jgi:uncharacterized tellurite resistance protein B-like protein
MQTYPTNSPEAAVRLLAMVLVADGHYALSELRALDRLEVPHRLGLSPQEVKAVIDTFCEDLTNATYGDWSGSALLDTATRDSLFHEIRDPKLQRQILLMCESLALADGHLAEGETDMLDAMAKAWRTAEADITW